MKPPPRRLFICSFAQLQLWFFNQNRAESWNRYCLRPMFPRSHLSHRRWLGVAMQTLRVSSVITTFVYKYCTLSHGQPPLVWCFPFQDGKPLPSSGSVRSAAPRSSCSTNSRCISHHATLTRCCQQCCNFTIF